MTVVDAPPERGVAAVQREVLASLVEPGLDVAAATAEFTTGRGRRRRTRRVVASSLAVLLLVVAGTTLLVSEEHDPDSVLADRDEQVEATTTSSTTVDPSATELAVAAPETVPVSTVVASTTVVTQPPASTPVETTPTTLPTNQALQATLTVLTPTVEAGATASIAVSWSDQDLGLGAGAPRYVVAWGDPLVSTPVDTSPRAACDAPGAPGSGADTLQFRYSTPGTYRVRVTLETCGGAGAFGERLVLEATLPISVTAPTFVDAADPALTSRGQSIVVFQPPLPNGAPWPPLTAAAADYVPSIDPTPVLLASGGSVPVFTTSGPATILVLPAGAIGTVRLRWSDPAICAATVGTDLSGPDGEVLSLPLSVVAC